MKKARSIIMVLLATTLVAAVYGFSAKEEAAQNSLTGAWMRMEDGNESVMLFMDGYATHTVYSKDKKEFKHTRGGPYTVSNNTFSVVFEFDTEDINRIGQTLNGSFEIKGDELAMKAAGDEAKWKRIDNGQAPLAGTWRITHRMQNNQLSPIHQTGPRKTLKVLTGNRFQWFAINPEAKEFSGTGGGTYTFEGGKYTEHIEFFSRDNQRVGASLTFNGKLEDGAWHHSGKSSRGEDIYEVWGRVR